VGGAGDTTRATIGGEIKIKRQPHRQPGWKECGRGGRGRWYNTGDSGGGAVNLPTVTPPGEKKEGGEVGW
jgi:hypothetical protein